MKKVSPISLGVLAVCVMFIVSAKAQSLTFVPKPSAEIVGLIQQGSIYINMPEAPGCVRD